MDSAHGPDLERVPGRLDPRLVGQRVVVRSVVPGASGPTGGPAFTDVLGVLESWGEHTVLIRRKDDALVEVPRSLIVSGKAIPPPSQRR